MPRARRAPTPEAVLRGHPHRLAGGVATGGVPAARVSVSLDDVEVRQVTVFPPGAADPDIVPIAVSVPRTTPPGVYRGTATIADRSLAIAVEVAPWPRVRSSPKKIVLSARPKASMRTEVTLRNVGNVPCEIPERSTFCLFDGRGVEHAFWTALDTEPTPERRRIDVLLDDLAEYHGGLVRLRPTTPQEALAPGEEREVEIALQFSDRLRSGCSYVGAWDLDGLRIPIRVTTAESSTPATSESEAA